MHDKLLLTDFFDLKPKGHLKLELFDGLTGKKVDERKKDNFISKFVLDHYLRFKMMDTIAGGRATMREEPGQDITSHFADPLQLIILNKDDHKEDALHEWLPRSPMIGYASTESPYSGGDEKRGTINQDESFSRMGHLRMVFDFPTHAANDTFRSVYFKPESSFTSSSSIYFDIDFDVGQYDEMGKFIKINNKYYVNGIKDGYYKYVIDIYDLNFNLETSYELKENYSDFTVKGDEFLLLDKDYREVGVAPISDPTQSETVLVMEGFNYATGIAYDEENQEIHVSNENGIFIYDRNYQLKDQVTLDYGISGYDPRLFYLGYGWINGNRFFGSQGGFVHGFGNDVHGVTTDELIISNGYSRVWIYPKYGIGSRALLDSPVTKTANVTMKITYDFMYS